MSKTLDEIKEEVAKEAGFANFQDVFFDEELSPNITDEIAERYAKEKFNEAIELAAENVQMKVHDGFHKTDSYSKHVQLGLNNIQLSKESILKLKQ